MYRKTYAGFIVWLLLFVLIMFAVIFIPADDPAVLCRVLVNLCTIGIAQLAWMIWRNERVYWYNGISFEEAEKAGSERRKEYAFRHFRLFGGYALVSLAITLGAYLMRIPWWVDMIVITIGLMEAAFRTMTYEL